MTVDDFKKAIGEYIASNDFINYDCLKYQSLKDAVEKLACEHFNCFDFDDFSLITAEIVEQEEECYNNVDSSCVGQWGYFDGEFHVTESTYSGWTDSARQKAEETNDVESVASYIFKQAVLDRLEALNKQRTHS